MINSMDLKVRMTMKHITLVCIASFLYSAQVSAWTKTFDWEGFPNASRDNAGMALMRNAETSNKYAHSGNMSLEIGVVKGDSKFGGSFGLPPKAVDGPSGERWAEMSLPDIKEGDEFWYRIWYYFPTGYDFTTDSSQGLKMSRIRTQGSGGGFEGSIDILIDSGITLGNEIKNALPSSQRNSQGSMVPRGKWHAIESYTKFSSVPGKSIRRVWQDGKLIFEDKQSPTLKTSKSTAAQMFLFTYWNGSAPKTQQCYMDDMVFTTDTPTNKDSSGNSYIGVGNVAFIAKPNPPSNIQ
jgi:hypothetical protein